MDLIEEKAFQRKQQLFVSEAGPHYSPLRPEYTPSGGSNTQRIHLNRILVSAHKFPKHHRVSPIGKLLIEEHFMTGVRSAPKPKKGAAPSGSVSVSDFENPEKVLALVREKFGKAENMGKAIVRAANILSALASARSLLINPATRAEILESIKGENEAMVKWFTNLSPEVEEIDGKQFEKLIQDIIAYAVKQQAAEEEQPQDQAQPTEAASPAGADVYTHVLKRLAQTDKRKASEYANSLQAQFTKDKRAYEVDTEALEVRVSA